MYGFSRATFYTKHPANEKIENYSCLNIIILELLTAVVYKWTTNRTVHAAGYSVINNNIKDITRSVTNNRRRISTLFDVVFACQKEPCPMKYLCDYIRRASRK